MPSPSSSPTTSAPDARIVFTILSKVSRAAAALGAPVAGSQVELVAAVEDVQGHHPQAHRARLALVQRRGRSRRERRAGQKPDGEEPQTPPDDSMPRDRRGTVSRGGSGVNGRETPLGRPEGMSGKPHERAAAGFEVPSQVGGSIANVGGNLYVGGERGRSVSIGRGGRRSGPRALLRRAVPARAGRRGRLPRARTGPRRSSTRSFPATRSPPRRWSCAGIVLNRFGRLFAGR